MLGKVALITGAAAGLGKAFCKSLLSKGAKVCVVDINKELGEKTVEEFKIEYGEKSAIFVQCDVADQLQLQDTFDKAQSELGKLNLVCNNAGIIDEANWKRTIDINLNSVIKGTLLGLQHMGKDQGGEGGHIINIASMAGLIPMNFGPAYTASKHGVVGWTRACAANFKHHGVRINCLCPAFTDTNIIQLNENQITDLKDAQEMLKQYGVLSKETVAEAFMQLVEEESYHGTALTVLHEGGIRPMKFPGEKPSSKM